MCNLSSKRRLATVFLYWNVLFSLPFGKRLLKKCQRCTPVCLFSCICLRYFDNTLWKRYTVVVLAGWHSAQDQGLATRGQHHSRFSLKDEAITVGSQGDGTSATGCPGRTWCSAALPGCRVLSMVLQQLGLCAAEEHWTHTHQRKTWLGTSLYVAILIELTICICKDEISVSRQAGRRHDS